MTVGAEPQLELVVRQPWIGRLAARFASRFGLTAYHGTLSVVDQLAVGGSRLLASVIVGRACGPMELGDYTLGLVVFYYAVCVQTGLVLLPYTLYCNYYKDDDGRAYSGSTLVHQALLCLALMIMLALASAVCAIGYGPPGLALLAAVLAVTFPLAFMQEFARRFALARLEMKWVLAVDGGAAVIQLGALLALAATGRLSALTALAAMGVGAAIAGVAWLVCSKQRFLIQPARLWTDARRNWHSGRWQLVSQLILATRVHAQVWLVALMTDLMSTGIYAACETLVRLSTPLPIAVANVLFPATASAYAAGDVPKVRSLVRRSAAVLSAGAVPFCLVFMFFGAYLLTKLYGEAFAGQATVLSLLVLSAITDAIDTAAGNGLFAIGRPNVHFYAALAGTLIMLALSVVLIPHWGLVGAAQGRLVGRSVTSGVQWLAFFRLSDRLLPGEMP